MAAETKPFRLTDVFQKPVSDYAGKRKLSGEPKPHPCRPPLKEEDVKEQAQ